MHQVKKIPFYAGVVPASLPPLAPTPIFKRLAPQAFVRDFVSHELKQFVELPQLYLTNVRKDILHRCVIWQRDAKRQGTHSAKNRSQVRCSTRKIRPQKKLGRARVGANNAPHFRGGGKAHGPVPRSHFTNLQHKVRELGLKSAIAAKYQSNQLILTQNMSLYSCFKTKTMLQHLNLFYPPTIRSSLSVALSSSPKKYGSILFVGDNLKVLEKACRSLDKVKISCPQKLTVLDILKHEYLVLDHDARKWLEWRLL